MIKMKILILASHPDDEVLGVGGTIAKHVSSGDDVYVCIVTSTYKPVWSDKYRKQKLQEQKEVDFFLGIKKRFHLNFPTVKLNTIPHGELNKKITQVVDEINPDIVYTHFEHDVNYDHTLVFQAALVTTRPPKKIKLLCYETLSETEWGSVSFQPNMWVDISGLLDKKINAFEIYKSEVREFPHPRSAKGIEFLAGKRGSEICVDCAEAFMMIRDVN